MPLAITFAKRVRAQIQHYGRRLLCRFRRGWSDRVVKAVMTLANTGDECLNEKELGFIRSFGH
jgi:hypothetical protein